MKTIMKIIWCILFLAVSVDAATYTVKAGGGGDYTTIQACATAISAGDTCTVYAGTYNENVTVTAGTAGNYKTINVNGSDTVNVLSFTLNSYTKVIGFHIQSPSAAGTQACITIAGGSTSVYITNNTITQCGSGDSRGGSMITTSNVMGASFVYVRGNTLSYGCGTPSAPDACTGIYAFGNHYLIENNDISHVLFGVNVNSTYTVIRNNTFHDTYQSECTSAPGCHMDFIFSEPSAAGFPTQYNLWEANTGRNSIGSDSKGFLTQADGSSCSGSNCYNVIIRFNSNAHLGSSNGMNDRAFPYVKYYNNTWVDVNTSDPLYQIANANMNNATHAANINDIFYYPQAMVDYNPYAIDSTTVGTFSVGHNLAYCTASPCNLHGKVYGSGSFTDDSGNLVSDPKFVNYAANDFHLQAGSPAIGAGTYLTSVAAGDSGSGTSLMVNDASYFQDGYGLTGVNPDWIRVGASTTVQISSINYATNTITVANTVSRSSGDPIYLYKDSAGSQLLFGSAPNIGAYFAASSSVAPPQSLTAVAQ